MNDLRSRPSWPLPTLAAAALTVLALALTGRADEPALQVRWWRGNTHTHTLWSDGNGAPEMVVDWYRRQGYDFLVLSDHNVLSVGEKWFEVSADGRLTPARVGELRARFGDDAVQTREFQGRQEMRLVTLPELQQRFAQDGAFLLIQGEEITDSFEQKPVHLNGLGLQEFVAPRGGASVADVIRRNLQAVEAQAERLGRPMLGHVNHPNFGWALTAEDLASVQEERFFEVYNGHSGVRNHGDAEHPSTEALWDVALTARLAERGHGLLYGVATDDAHEMHAWGVGRTNPGRGWVMVRAARLDQDDLLEALQRGDFHASSGVYLDDVRSDATSLTVDLATEDGLTYRTEFVGTRNRPGATIGEVLAETDADPAVYRFQGDEWYVRARVISSRLHPNPYAEGDHEMAWVQPVLGPGHPER